MWPGEAVSLFDPLRSEPPGDEWDEESPPRHRAMRAVLEEERRRLAASMLPYLMEKWRQRIGWQCGPHIVANPLPFALGEAYALADGVLRGGSIDPTNLPLTPPKEQ